MHILNMLKIKKKNFKKWTKNLISNFLRYPGNAFVYLFTSTNIQIFPDQLKSDHY